MHGWSWLVGAARSLGSWASWSPRACPAPSCPHAVHLALLSPTHPSLPAAAVCVILGRAFHPRVSALVLATFAVYAAWTVVLTKLAAGVRREVKDADNEITGESRAARDSCCDCLPAVRMLAPACCCLPPMPPCVPSSPIPFSRLTPRPPIHPPTQRQGRGRAPQLRDGGPQRQRPPGGPPLRHLAGRLPGEQRMPPHWLRCCSTCSAC